MYKAMVVDDHPLVVSGIAEFLQSHCGFQQVQTASGGQECLRLLQQAPAPSLVVVDFWLADGTAADLVSAIRRVAPAARLLAISGDEDAAVIFKARQAGTDGFVHKQATPALFADAVAALLRGELFFPQLCTNVLEMPQRRNLPLSARDLGLTARQGEILAMMLRGLPNKRIAQQLALSDSTVKEHVTGILNRLGVSNRVEAITLLRGRQLEP